MKISVIGSGYAGLVNAVGFAHLGNHVTCADIDQKKIDLINSGKSPIYEEDLEYMLQDALKKGNIKATTNIEKAVTQTDLTFIAVGTPSNEDGSINLKYIEAVSKDIGNILKNKEKSIETIIPDLKKLHENPDTKPVVQVFYGDEGLKYIMDMQTQDNHEIFVLASKDSVAEILRFTYPEYVKKRVEKNIWLNFIFNSFEGGKNISSAPLSRVRYFPKEYSVPSTFMLWGSKSAIMLFTEKKPIIMLFNNEKIAKDFMDYFSLIWEIAIR